MSIKTYTARAADIERRWYLFDATGQTLGRLASDVALLLMGKRKPTYSPNLDMGDHVVVVNAGRVRVTGRKLTDKKYRRHSGYPGGYRERTLQQMLDQKPAEVLRLAVKGMLPSTKLGDAMLRKLHVYAEDSHPHGAQNPQPIETGAKGVDG